MFSFPLSFSLIFLLLVISTVATVFASTKKPTAISLTATIILIICLFILRKSLKVSISTEKMTNKEETTPNSSLLNEISLNEAYLSTIEKQKQPSLSTTEWREFPLLKKTKVSENSSIYEFSLPTPESVLGITVGQHLSVHAVIDGKEVQRSYTPISVPEEKGKFQLLVKTYEKGLVSAHFAKLEPSFSCISCRGPRGNYKYEVNNTIQKHIGMVAGGTGITPMYQVLRAVLDNLEDTAKVSLIFANVTEKDILLRSELDKLAELHPNRFNLHYVLSNPPENWSGGSSGRIDKDTLAKYLNPPTKNTQVLLCGPPLMVKSMVLLLEEIGYDKAKTISKPSDQVFKF